LMDIKWAIKKSFIFGVLVLLITSLFSIVTYFLSVYVQDHVGNQSVMLSGIITAIAVAVGYDPLKKILTRLTDKYLYQGGYDFHGVLSTFSRDLRRFTNTGSIAQYVVNIITKSFRSQNCAFFLYNRDANKFRSIATVEMAKDIVVETTPATEEFYKEYCSTVSSCHIIKRSYLKKISKKFHSAYAKTLVEIMDNNDVELILFMFFKDDMVGFFTLGGRKSGEKYNERDIKLLEILANESAVSIRTVDLYKGKGSIHNVDFEQLDVD